MSVTITEKAAKEIQRVFQRTEDAGDDRAAYRRGGRWLQRLPIQPGLRRTDRHREGPCLQPAWDSGRRRQEEHLFLDGTTVDFYDGLEKRGFTFENPNAVKTCGCGNSFSA